ncbi:hypothetical protein C365_00323 [Cryptococcus neoformans Bt85]|nr:hypothetical protein C365_00323 [Cryptococcus neoformans var. grubii Bt85]
MARTLRNSLSFWQIRTAMYLQACWPSHRSYPLTKLR